MDVNYISIKKNKFKKEKREKKTPNGYQFHTVIGYSKLFSEGLLGALPNVQNGPLTRSLILVDKFYCVNQDYLGSQHSETI